MVLMHALAAMSCQDQWFQVAIQLRLEGNLSRNASCSMDQLDVKPIQEGPLWRIPLA